AKESQEALKLDGNSAAAYYLLGSSDLRMQKYEPAVQALQQARHLDPTVAAVSFQLGRAHQALRQWEAARDALQDAVDLEPQHIAAHYVLSQVLLRLGDQPAATKELEKHKQVLAKLPDGQPDESTYEKCVYTQINVPFDLAEQPAGQGVKVTFTDVTATAFGGKMYHGPIGILDIDHKGGCDLFVAEGDGTLRLLRI